MYPEIVQHGILVGLEFSGEKNAYIVTLRKGAHHLSTHLETNDAKACMEGTRCLALGVQIAQLISNFEGDRPYLSEMRIMTVCGKSMNVDDEGYLVNYYDWDENVASALAENEGLTALTKDHVDILKFIRNHYEQYHYFPVIHAVCKNLDRGKDCLDEMFMNPLITWKIAGLPKPDAVVRNLLEHNEPPT